MRNSRKHQATGVVGAEHLTSLARALCLAATVLVATSAWAVEDSPSAAPADSKATSSPTGEGAAAAPEGADQGAVAPRREGRGRQRIPIGRGGVTGRVQEIQVPTEVRKAVLRNELHRRLSAVARSQRLSGSAPGGGRWARDALGGGQTVPVQTSFTRENLRTIALRDGSRIWLASGRVSEPGAILRLGDLLPLLSVIGINDRQAALSVTEVAFGGGTIPPAYTMTFRTGALWPHREALVAAEAAGRITYSIVSGRVTVLGALVVADGEGDLSVRLVSPQGDDLTRYRDLVMPAECRPLDAALRGAEPASAARQASNLLDQPSVVQGCAARYYALAKPEGAVDRLRRLMSSGAVGMPRDLVEALVFLEPTLTEENLSAVTRMVERAGVAGADAVCTNGPLLWSDTLLASDQISEPNKRVIRRCLRR